jgi:polyisoprenoid-binding protein YceI
MSQTQAAAAAATNYTIDPAHSAVHFKIRHMMISNVRGHFGKVSGSVRFDAAHPENSSVTAEIDVSTINTREPDRDAHLKSPDFFHVEQHPVMTFQSTKVTPAGSGEYKVTGNLTIRGVTKEVTMHVEGPTPEAKDPWGNTRSGAEAKLKINRKDFGLTWNQVLEAGGVLVGEEVEVDIEAELIKA